MGFLVCEIIQIVCYFPTGQILKTLMAIIALKLGKIYLGSQFLRCSELNHTVYFLHPKLLVNLIIFHVMLYTAIYSVCQVALYPQIWTILF